MTDATKRVVGRRAVVRGAVATAWSVPLVQAVAAAPAFAVSNHPDLSQTTGSIVLGGGGTGKSATPYVLTLNATVKNSGAAATKALGATLNMTDKNGATFTAASGDTKWTTRSTPGTTWSWTATSQLPATSPGNTTTFSWTVTLSKKPTNASVTLTFGDAGAPSGIISANF